MTELRLGPIQPVFLKQTKNDDPELHTFYDSILCSRESSAEEYSLPFLWLLAWDDTNSNHEVTVWSQGCSASCIQTWLYCNAVLLSITRRTAEREQIRLYKLKWRAAHFK